MKSKLFKFLLFAFIAIISGIFGAWLFNTLNIQNEQRVIINYSEPDHFFTNRCCYQSWK